MACEGRIDSGFVCCIDVGRRGRRHHPLNRFGALDLRIDTKPDLTPVTDADQAVEEQLRRLLTRERPHDAVPARSTRNRGLGGQAMGDRPYRRDEELRARRSGVASLIALLDDGVPVVGVVSAGAEPAVVGRIRTGCFHRIRWRTPSFDFSIGSCRPRFGQPFVFEPPVGVGGPGSP